VTFDRLGVEPEISSTITDAAPETPHCSAEPPAGRRASLYWPVAGRGRPHPTHLSSRTSV